MGTHITLDLGDLNVHWGKNEYWFDHSPLFQVNDVKKSLDSQIDVSETEQPTEREICTRRLRDVVPRLELLGYSKDSLRRDFRGLEIDGKKIKSFKRIEDVFLKTSASGSQGHFFENEDIVIDPWIVLRLLALNKENLDVPLTWNFHDWVENGWGNRSWIMQGLPDAQKFLLLTEGRSDADILKKAFNLLRPDVADFFRFVNMECHPFGGEGGLRNFCRGLVNIGHSNFTLAIYDNDTAGIGGMLDSKSLKMPKNMRVMSLPSMKEFSRFATLGPNGERKENINGRAVAIECFLDLHHGDMEEPKVRWKGFDEKAGKYQGELINKHEYAKEFSKLSTRDRGYSFEKLEHLLDAIIAECVGIAGDSRRHAWNQAAFDNAAM